jgi:hypothetical protein
MPPAASRANGETRGDQAETLAPAVDDTGPVSPMRSRARDGRGNTVEIPACRQRQPGSLTGPPSRPSTMPEATTAATGLARERLEACGYAP